jgi:hypothetical protein
MSLVSDLQEVEVVLPRTPSALCILLVALTLEASLPVRASGGLITKAGPTGMFLNPVAEVSPPNTINAQTCWLRQDVSAGIVNSNILMVAHTLPTATELGLLVDLVTPQGGSAEAAVGGFLRQLVWPEAQWLSITPAFAVGATGFHNEIQMAGFNVRATVFAVLSKTLTPPGFPLPVRAHLGGRFIDYSDPTDARDATGYLGLEVDLLTNLRLFGEVNTQTRVDTTTPFAVGLQYSLGKMGISAAAINSGRAGAPGLFFGIGFPFATE